MWKYCYRFQSNPPPQKTSSSVRSQSWMEESNRVPSQWDRNRYDLFITFTARMVTLFFHPMVVEDDIEPIRFNADFDRKPPEYSWRVCFVSCLAAGQLGLMNLRSVCSCEGRVENSFVDSGLHLWRNHPPPFFSHPCTSSFPNLSHPPSKAHILITHHPPTQVFCS